MCTIGICPHLQSQAHAQDKGCNARDESTEEGVEGERADEAAVNKLDNKITLIRRSCL